MVDEAAELDAIAGRAIVGLAQTLRPVLFAGSVRQVDGTRGAAVGGTAVGGMVSSPPVPSSGPAEDDLPSVPSLVPESLESSAPLPSRSMTQPVPSTATTSNQGHRTR
jgi:hypothetical protein